MGWINGGCKEGGKRGGGGGGEENREGVKGVYKNKL